MQSLRPRINAFLQFFHSTCLKYSTWHEKVMPGHTKCCTWHANHLPKTEDLMLQNATPLRKSAPGPSSSSDERVSCTALATENASLQTCLLSFLEMPQNLHVLLTFDKVHNPLRPRETTSERQKVVRAFSVFNMFTSKCASPHNGVHFFDISTLKVL